MHYPNPEASVRSSDVGQMILDRLKRSGQPSLQLSGWRFSTTEEGHPYFETTVGDTTQRVSKYVIPHGEEIKAEITSVLPQRSEDPDHSPQTFTERIVGDAALFRLLHRVCGLLNSDRWDD
jgi:hypothetical protein